MIKHSYIDKTGKIVIDASRYESASGFFEGLAAVGVQRKGWGFIDKTGAFVIALKFEGTLGFSEGLAAVVLDGKWGFINKNGVLVIENQYDCVAGFSEGVAVVQRSSKPKRSQAPPPNGATITFKVEVWTCSIQSSGPRCIGRSEDTRWRSV